MGRKDTSALSGTLNAPAGYAGDAPPIRESSPVEITDADGKTLKASASPTAVTVLHGSALLILIAIVLLWAFGGIVFKNANL